MPMTISGDGTITGLNAGGLPSATVTQATLATPVAGTGPAFSAYANAQQTLSSGVFTKVSLQAEQFDTANCFDSTTNYRFTPNVAGYYQINANLYCISTTTMSRVIGSIYKNGATLGRFFDLTATFSNNPVYASGSNLVYLNGTTDYVELYAYLLGTDTLRVGQNDLNTVYFQGFLARSA